MTATQPDPPPVLALLADPVRWRLLVELAASDRRVGELTELVDRPQNLVSYHLRELRAGGLVAARRSSADRRDVYYRADLHGCRHSLAAAGLALHPALHLAPGPPATGVHRRTKVLFLCTGNSARSQMAEALLVHRTGGSVTARSAGSHPRPLHPNAVRVMAERGIDIASRPSTHLRRFASTRFDRVITLCDKVREVCPELPGAPVAAHWSLADPAASATTDAGSYPAFCALADELEGRIDLLIDELAAQPRERTAHAHR